MTQLTHSWNGGSTSDTVTYGYTNDDQLTSVAHSNSSFANESFGYDANGNRDTTGYSTGSGNEESSDGTYNYTYDADGNLATKTAIATGVQTLYTWDYRNRLTQVQQVSGGTTTTIAQYTYDPLSRPIEVVEGGATRYTLYDGQTPLLDFNGAGSVTARYLSVPGAIDELLARQTSSGVAWYLDDREGSVGDIVNNSGSVIDHVDYGAYGNVAAESSPANGDRFKYAGMELDGVTGLDYDRARYYDPADGNFLGEDPAGFAAGTANLRQYAGNDPLGSLDQTGLAAKILLPGATGAPTIGEILGDPVVQEQLNWYWHRVGANSGREEGGYVLYNTCTKKFILTVDGMTQDTHHRIKYSKSGPTFISSQYRSNRRPLKDPTIRPPLGSPQPKNPKPTPPPRYPLVGPPEPIQGCWFVVAAWHTHPGDPRSLSPRDPDDPKGNPGDYGPIDKLGIPVIVQWGPGPNKVVGESP